MNSNRIEELLDQWEEHHERGDVVSARYLCPDDPKLQKQLEGCIQALQALSWMDTVPTSDNVNHEDCTNIAEHDTVLPATSLTVDEFAGSVCRSALLTEEELRSFRTNSDSAGLPCEEEDARALAQRIVSSGKLTAYQAAVVLEERNDPLLIDRYIILDALGSGGMGVVFKALHKPMDRVVALKLLPRHAVDSPEKVERFQREARAAAMLSHPNIVTVFDAAESNGAHFLAMEYVPGPDLYSIVRQNGPLPIGQASRFVRDAATALQHAHEQGIIHRDIKPGNLLLGPDSVVKVTDLGLASVKTLESDDDSHQQLTQGGVVLGTISFISPEQALESHLTDARSDIYSLGATLFCLLIGRPPYKEETAIKTLIAHRESPVPSLRDLRDDVPAELEAICRRMLAKRPEDRFASMQDVAEAIDALDIADDSPSDSAPTSVDLPSDRSPVKDADFASATDIQSPDTDLTEHKSRGGRGLNLLWLLLGAAGIFLGVVIVITNKDGKQLRIDISDAASVTMERDGQEHPINLLELGVKGRAEGLSLLHIARVAYRDDQHDLTPPYRVTVSPDGRHVYASLRNRSAVNIFGRNTATGHLTYFESRQQTTLHGVIAMAVSPDGRFFYTAGPLGGGRITIFQRNESTGHLSSFRSVSQAQVPALGGPIDFAFSPQADHLYVAAVESEALLTFRRDQQSGVLTYVSSRQRGSNGIEHRFVPTCVAVSSDGRNVYTTGNSDINVFARDVVTGELSFTEVLQDDMTDLEKLTGANNLAISSDGRFLYVTCQQQNAVCIFRRDSETGQLAFTGTVENRRDGVLGMASPHNLALSPDNREVVVVCYHKGDNSAVLFRRDEETGQLAFVDVLRDGINDVDGLSDAVDIDFSPDGKHVYVAARADNAITTLSINHGDAATSDAKQVSTGTETSAGTVVDRTRSQDSVRN